MNSTIMLLLDSLAILLSFSLGSMVRSFLQESALQPFGHSWEINYLVIGGWAIGAAMYGIIPGWGLSTVETLRRKTVLTCLVFGGTIAALFLVKEAEVTSRLTVLLSFLFALGLIPVIRMHGRAVLIRHGSWGVPVAIYGGGQIGRSVIERLREEAAMGYNPVVVFDDDETLWDQEVEGLPVLGGTFTLTPEASFAIHAMPDISSKKTASLIEGPLACYRRIILIPNTTSAPSLWVEWRDLSGLPAYEIKHNLLDSGKRFLKTVTEITLVLATAPAWGTMCAIAAAVIWLEDRKNPFFSQERVGRNGKIFKTWKFRTMSPDAEAILERWLQDNESFARDWKSNCKLQKDPRITRVGRLLRKTSIDELPQLFNVLKREMSLVGPRPLPQYHYELLPENVRGLRERVRPGITGMWQVSGRSEAGNAGMVRWDPYYVHNWSLWLDVVILVRTFKVVLKGSGAV